MTTDTQNPARDDALDAKSAVPDAPHPETTASPSAPTGTAETVGPAAAGQREGGRGRPKLIGLRWLVVIVAVSVVRMRTHVIE